MPLTGIFTRSPRVLELTGTANQTTRIEIFLWNSPASIPATANYILSKPIPSSVYTSVFYDISPYCREFINHVGFAEVSSDTAADVDEYCYCTVKTYVNNALTSTLTYIAFDGWGYFADGMNPGSPSVFLTEGTYYVSDTGNMGSLFYHDDQTLTWTAVYTGLSTAGTTTVTLGSEVGQIPLVHSSYVGEGNLLELKQNAVLKKTYTIEEICEGRYTIVDCDFVNKWGAWQRIVFFKASSSSIQVDNKEFNLMPSAANYNIQENIRQSFNTNGTESIKCNTGWVVEGYGDVMQEMMLSEKILINDRPVNVKTKSLDKKKNINDKTINYTIEFDYANQIINYVL
jgi:hypothetical protein